MKGRQRTCSCSGSILWQPGGQFCLRRYMSNPQSLRKSYMRFKATCSLLRRLMCVDNSRLLDDLRARSVLLLPTTEGKYDAALIIFMYKCNKCNVIMIQDTFQAIDEFYCYNWWPFFHLRCSNMFSKKKASIITCSDMRVAPQKGMKTSGSVLPVSITLSICRFLRPPT